MIQISNADGDISINAEWPRTEDLAKPGNLSIAPPVDYLGRPIHGREELVDQLLQSCVGADSYSVNVLCGLGGSGKSTLAMLLANKASKADADVWWISATSLDALHAGMRQLTVTLGAPQSRLLRAWSGRESATDLLWDLLRRHERKWLLVIDGADDPSLLAASGAPLSDGTGWIRPTLGSGGSIVVTTRDGSARNWAAWCSLQPVGMLSAEDATAVLIDYAGDQPGGSRDAERLAIRLGRLPLALRLAGTYIKSNARVGWPGAITTYDEYLGALEAQITELFPELDQDGSAFADREARELIGCTWELSLSMLEQRGLPEGRSLLQVLSHFADSPIPAAVLEPEILQYFGVVEQVSSTRLRVVVEALADVGLVELRSSKRVSADIAVPEPSLALHPLVRDVGRYPNRLHKPRDAYLSAATLMVAKAAGEAPNPDWTSWPLWQTLSIHAFYLLSEVLHETKVQSDVIDAAAYGASRSARFLMSRGEFERAEIEQKRALEALGRIVDFDHPNALSVRHDVGVNLGRLGRLPEAELELRSIRDRKIEIFGPKASQTLSTMHAHADVLWQQGKLDRAEKEYKFILSVFKERDQGDDNAVGTRNNLIQVLVEQGKYSEAVAEVDDFVSEATPERFARSTVLHARFVRARVRMAQAKFVEAVAELREVVDEQTATLGENHPTTLATRHELGVALQVSGEPGLACQVLHPAFIARTKAQGSDHPDTLTTRHQYALALHEAGRSDEAEVHYRATLSLRTKVLGDRNLNTLATRFQLAVLLEESGNLPEAEEQFLGVLVDECSTIGADHPSTLITRMRLANYAIGRGQFPEAFTEFNRVLIARRRVLGDDHPATRETEQAIAALRAMMSS
ncbi:tetratricopeptide repeat protein [Micromonospora globispora]|uniref:tetratricopeptide repeat protein n=1 Tax=Micromonospora globispora TaxID=1450148 RepID=UPI00140242B6